jgi:hypothetical protein
MLLMGSAVCTGAVDIEQINRLMIAESCERLVSNVNQLMRINEAINKEDPQARMETRKTLLQYLQIIENHCPSNRRIGVGPKR